MRVVSVRKGNSFRLGVLKGESVLDLVDLTLESGGSAPFLANMELFLEAGVEAQDWVSKQLKDSGGEAQGRLITSLELGPPVPRPSKIIAVGLNYKDHVAEAGFQLPESPLIFAKVPNSISGPQGEIVIPSEDMQGDSGAGLAVVIGRRAKAITAESAYEYVAGYMGLNDVSARKWQFADKQWTRGKSCEKSSPAGRGRAPADEIPA